MRSCLLGCLLLLAVAGAVPKRHRMGRLGVLSPRSSNSRTNTVTSGQFTQQLDHFEPTNNATWSQRYFASDNYYKKGGPVFIMIGGEGLVDETWMRSGAWVEYAQKYNALLFLLEHRYYGESQPTSDISDKNLIYLSSEQALADIAFFVKGMNTKYQLPQGTKWIVFGGSYAGNLAAWVRYKYPHLIHAAVASSAPVLAKVDFFEYVGVVRDSLGTYGESCPKAVEQAHQQLVQKLITTNGQEEIRSLFNLCSPVNVSNQMDVHSLLDVLTGVFCDVVQYNKQEPKLTIDHVCGIMTDKDKGTLLQRLASVNKLMDISECLEYSYEEFINDQRNTSRDYATTEGERQWKYQTCTEFGFFPTSENKKLLFGTDLPLNYHLQQCVDIFGQGFSEKEVYNAVYRTNTMYGGLDIKATRVVYVHGTIDPWRALGITKTRIPESPSILIPGTSHCADMDDSKPDDPAPLKAARKKIQRLIRKWLKKN